MKRKSLLTLAIIAVGLTTAQVNAESIVTLENSKVTLQYKLTEGVFNISNKSDGTRCIDKATARINQTLSAGKAKRSWTKTDVNNLLGTGQSLTVTSSSKDGLELIQVFTLYPNSSAIELQCGLRNNSSTPVSIKEIAVLDEASLWPGITHPTEQKTLDGLSGSDSAQPLKTRVEDGADRWSYNNLFYTFKHKNQRHCLVLGGLVYDDFIKIARIQNSAVSLYAKDPVGRRVDPGQRYMPKDSFYFDAFQSDPFVALETYGRQVALAHDVKLQTYTFPTVCAWYAFRKDNHTVRCVEEIDYAQKSGFLEYAPVGVRLVPDKYQGDTEQGWWDDEHWRSVKQRYRKPYDTSESYSKAVLERGGIPLTYVQAGMPSDDYAKAFPGHMLNNEISELDKKHAHHHPYVSFDYTDKDFQSHLSQVWKSLGQAKMGGVMFDYPETAWRSEGGFEDEYSTTAAAYRKMYELCREGLGPEAYIHERNMGAANRKGGEHTPVIDNTIGLVSSQRVLKDNRDFSPKGVSLCGLRWYKCRTLVAYDMDSKAVDKDQDQRRAMLTMVYTVSGRLLLATSFADMTEAMIHDLSRTFPYHEQPKSARPLDLFLRENPMVYDFDITDDWHQLCLYNSRSKTEPTDLSVQLSGVRADGAMGLDPQSEYYIYDFWNDAFIGRLTGTETLNQTLRAGEARMLSIHKKQPVPQFLSTSRHLMQGYLDLTKKPVWIAADNKLEGNSAIVKNDPYELVFACNGKTPIKAKTSSGQVVLDWKNRDQGIAVLKITSHETSTIQWNIEFK